MGKIDFTGLGIKKKFSFENLVVGPHNQFAAAACKSVAKSPGDTYNPLYVYGPPGIGKTHLVQAIAQEMLKEDPDRKVMYLSAERLMSDIITAIADDNVMAVRQRYSQLDLLIIDDVQYLAESKATQEELLHIFNNMASDESQVVLAANQSPNKLSGFSQRLQSRLEGGLAASTGAPDLEVRIEILRGKQKEQDLTIPDEMLLFVAQRLKSNVRELEGFLKRMHAYVHLSHQEVNDKLIQSVIQEILPNGSEPITDIIIHESDGLSAQGAPPPVRQGTPQQAVPAPEPPAPPPKKKAVPKPEKPAPKKEEPKEKEVIQEAEELQIDRYSVGQEEAPKKNGHTKKPKEEKPTEISRDDIIEIDDKPEPPPEPVAPAPKPAPKKGEAKEASAPASEIEPEPKGGSVEEEAEPSDENKEEALPAGHKEILSVFFYPKTNPEIWEKVYQKFQDVIKKHKLKFRLKCVHSEEYAVDGKQNYSSFVDVCKSHHVPVAIVIGPPPNVKMAEQDFYDLLSVTLDVQGISLQIVNWSEIEKDYRYLNLSLDIALVRTR